jgi:hypothetical protein
LVETTTWPVAAVPDLFPWTHRGGLPCQDKEYSLERIFRVVFVVEDTTAHPKNHRPVPTDEGLEGVLVPVFDEGPQQSPVRGPVVLAQDGPTKLVQNRLQTIRRHLMLLAGVVPTEYSSLRAGFVGLFFSSPDCGCNRDNLGRRGKVKSVRTARPSSPSSR